MLAVFASGIACAQTYSGVLETTYTAGNAALNTCSSGSVQTSNGATLSWANTFHNSYTAAMWVTPGWTTSPSNGLSNPEVWTQVLPGATVGNSSTVSYPQVTAPNGGGYYLISANHVWTNFGTQNAQSNSDSSMSFTV